MKYIANPISPEAPDSPTPDSRRCQFCSADGRRCRMPRWEAHPTFCTAHAQSSVAHEFDSCGLRIEPVQSRTKLQPEPAAMIDLAPLSGEFTTATEINRALGKVFLLLAQNRIPRQNAVALGYIAQLLLQTLPGVREEMTRCLGQEAWDETLDSVFPEDDTPDERTNDETELRVASNAETETEDENSRKGPASNASAATQPENHPHSALPADAETQGAPISEWAVPGASCGATTSAQPTGSPTSALAISEASNDASAEPDGNESSAIAPAQTEVPPKPIYPLGPGFYGLLHRRQRRMLAWGLLPSVERDAPDSDANRSQCAGAGLIQSAPKTLAPDVTQAE